MSLIPMFCAATGATEQAARIWAPHAAAAAFEFGIDTPRRFAGFLAQMSVESGKFTNFIESLNYSPQGLASTWPKRFGDGKGGPNALAYQLGRGASKPADQQGIANLCYGGRYGNTRPGDGWLYRGRGPKQITFYDNYRDAEKGTGVAFLANPDLMLSPTHGMRAAAWYWKSRNINALIDRQDFVAVSKAVNGGDIGLKQRIAQHQIANRAFNVS